MEKTSTTTKSKPLEMGCVEERDMITSDGRNIGQFKGVWLDVSNWNVSSIIIELDKNVVEELNVKKPMLRSAKVSVPITYVKTIADVVQINTDISGLSAGLASLRS